MSILDNIIKLKGPLAWRLSGEGRLVKSMRAARGVWCDKFAMMDEVERPAGYLKIKGVMGNA